MVPSGSSGWGPVPGLSPGFRRLLAVRGVPWLVDVPLQSAPSSLRVPVLLCRHKASKEPLIGPTPVPRDFILTQSAKTLLPNKATLEQPYFSANAQFFQALSQCSALQRLCLVSRSGTLQPEAVLAFMARCLHVVVCHLFTGESLSTCRSLQQSLLRRTRFRALATPGLLGLLGCDGRSLSLAFVTLTLGGHWPGVRVSIKNSAFILRL
ncbi:hypothetical protein J1605_019516 [Eschrichtius robustus]|uniref:F-box/LRR-repeat protein 18 LRR domain-containing protein n=1 Tax=Eschrichtius robustus TaxID=9764 RepID=A0AB34HNV4_ESCRO|nr:hypothetical protein J1605_019516 [Eschrichtius robustus]